MIFGDIDNLSMLLRMRLMSEEGEEYRVIRPPKNPDLKNMFDITTTNIKMVNYPNPLGHLAYYSIDIEGRLHHRSNCKCDFKRERERVLVNFVDEMGLSVQDIKFLGGNQLDLTLAPCMVEDEV